MRIIILILLVSTTIYTAWPQPFINSYNCYQLTTLDVGQGDAFLLQTPSGTDILIDGGNQDQKALDQLGSVMPWLDRHIDLVIATHAHADHVGGLVDILQRYDVTDLVVSGVDPESDLYEAMLAIADKKQINIVPVTNDDHWSLNDVEIDFIYPLTSQVNLLGKDNANNDSIVGRIDIDGLSVLFSGDAEQEVESEIMEAIPVTELDADIMLAGHHGSRTSNTPEFIEAISPSHVIVQAGRENSYGHPHTETLSTFSEAGANIYRTDLDGQIRAEWCSETGTLAWRSELS